MKILFILASVMVVFFLGLSHKVEAQKKAVARTVVGTISGYECGDNCYLTITDSKGKAHVGLCSARSLCTSWNADAAMPESYKGKKVTVTIGKGTLLTGSGQVAGTMDAFTSIQMMPASSSVNVANSLRRVDFRNFTYPLDEYHAKEYKVSSVRVKKGRFIFSRDRDYGPDGLAVTKIIFGDLTGDGQEEAAVITAIGFIDSGTSQQAPGSYAYIYTMENGQPVLLKIFDAVSFDSDAEKYYGDYYRDDTSLFYAGVTNIQSGLLVVESLAGGARCCPEYEVTMKFRWDGQRFILSGNPQRKKMSQ